ncbi:venom metalloproteinase 2-like [Ixodes scapularis]|uniref:venom metalloproteinase 2-like n=1 Tax=Ixodes scapularis TaxID=6945 RepID=UPI001C38FFFF|nr:venom metalloproteinase 2-like [Ixodes scapularis]
MKTLVMFMALGSIMVGANTISMMPNITLGVRFVCDTSLVKARQDKNHTTALREYISIFLNTVDLYLRKSECPKVNLVLTGVNETTEEVESRFEKMNNELGGKRLDPTFTLGLFQHWVQKNIKFNNDDIVFLLTSIIIEDHIGSAVSPNGYSYFNEICSLGVGLVRDSGVMFDGVLSAAQQIAHMLGSPWDISDACPGSGETLMAPRYLSRPQGLSECTKEALRQQYNNNTIKDACWKKTLKPDASSNRSLPVTYFQTEDYCSTRHSHRVFKCPEGNKYHVANATKCSMGCCVNNTKEAGGFKYSVPDGTPCGDNKICIYAECSEFSKENSD